MVLDFAALPPEINSGLMYAGAGAGPLMAAAGAWNNLAAELSTTASSYESILTALTTEQWTGAGSTAAAAAAQPYVSWLSTTATASEQAATQAMASAAAYEAAYTATVHPALIAANRATLAALVATNFLGINTPAIMATEAHYAEMWVQDATAMYTYAASSAAAGVLQPLTPATPTTSPAAPAVQAAAVSQAASASPAQGIISDLQSALSGLQAAVQASPLGGVIDDIGTLAAIPIVQNTIYNVGVTVAWNTGNIEGVFPVLGHFLASSPAGVTTDILTSDVTPLEGGLSSGTLVANTVSGGGVGGAMTAGLGEASSVGGLSVPASWSTAAPATLASATAPLEGSGWTVPAESGGATMMPGMPGMAAAAKGAGAFAAGPRYGFKPIVMPKQVVI